MASVEKTTAESLGIPPDKLSVLVRITTVRIRGLIAVLCNSSTTITVPQIESALQVQDSSITPLLEEFRKSGLVAVERLIQSSDSRIQNTNRGLAYSLTDPWRDFFYATRGDSNTKNVISETDMEPFSRFSYIFHRATHVFLSRCFPDLLKGNLLQSQILDKNGSYLTSSQKKQSIQALIAWIAEQYQKADGILVVDRSEGKESDPLISLNADFKDWYERMKNSLQNLPEVTPSTTTTAEEPVDCLCDIDPKAPMSSELTVNQRILVLAKRVELQMSLIVEGDSPYISASTLDASVDFPVKSERLQEIKADKFAFKKLREKC